MTVIDLLEQRLQKVRITGKGSVHLSPDVAEIIIDELKKFELLKQNIESNDEINIPKTPKQSGVLPGQISIDNILQP